MNLVVNHQIRVRGTVPKIKCSKCNVRLTFKHNGIVCIFMEIPRSSFYTSANVVASKLQNVFVIIKIVETAVYLIFVDFTLHKKIRPMEDQDINRQEEYLIFVEFTLHKKNSAHGGLRY